MRLLWWILGFQVVGVQANDKILKYGHESLWLKWAFVRRLEIFDSQLCVGWSHGYGSCSGWCLNVPPRALSEVDNQLLRGSGQSAFWWQQIFICVAEYSDEKGPGKTVRGMVQVSRGTSLLFPHVLGCRRASSFITGRPCPLVRIWFQSRSGIKRNIWQMAAGADLQNNF